MIVYIRNRSIRFDSKLTPQTLYAICAAAKEGDVSCLIRLRSGDYTCYYGADKIDMARTFTDEIMANIACPKAHQPTYSGGGTDG